MAAIIIVLSIVYFIQLMMVCLSVYFEENDFNTKIEVLLWMIPIVMPFISFIKVIINLIIKFKELK